MAVRKRNPSGHILRGSEMRKLGESLQHELRKTRKQLTEAEWLIRELNCHEGAEGWSQYLYERLDAYKFYTKEQDHVRGS